MNRLKDNWGLFSPKIKRMVQSIDGLDKSKPDQDIALWLDTLDNKVKVARVSRFKGFKSPHIFRETIFKNKRVSENIKRTNELLLSSDQINFNYNLE